MTKRNRQPIACQCHQCAGHASTDVLRCRVEGVYSYGWLGQVYGGFKSEIEAASAQLRRLDADMVEAEQAQAVAAEAEAEYSVARTVYNGLYALCERLFWQDESPANLAAYKLATTLRQNAYEVVEACLTRHLATRQPEPAAAMIVVEAPTQDAQAARKAVQKRQAAWRRSAPVCIRCEKNKAFEKGDGVRCFHCYMHHQREAA